MSTIHIKLTAGRDHTAHIKVDPASGEVVGADGNAHIRSVNLAEWAKVYPGAALEKTANLNIKDFAGIRKVLCISKSCPIFT